MTSPQLATFAANLAANTLTPGERGALLTALNAFLAEFPQPDEISNASEAMPAIQVTWVSALFAIQGNGGTPVPPPNTGIIIVGNLAALTATSVAGLIAGTPAIVNSVGADYTLAAAASAPAIGGTAVVASTDPTLVWVRGLTRVAVQALNTTDWYWDPQAGNDENTGALGSPLLTFGEIVRRYGTASPTLPPGQSVTVHLLMSQPLGVDPVAFSPVLSKGGQAILIGTLILRQGVFAAGAVTAKVRGGPGQLLTVAGMPGGTTANQLVFNQTRNSYAYIDSIAGGTATMQQPLTGASISTVGVPAAVQDNTWQATDALEIFDPPSCNLVDWTPIASDENTGGAKASVGWVQFIRVSDSSGADASIFGFVSRAVANVLSMCRVDARSCFSSLNGRGFECYALGCTFVGLVQTIAGGGANFQGGGFALGLNATSEATLSQDVIVHHACEFIGAVVQLTNCYTDAPFIAFGPAQLRSGVANGLWGPGGVQLLMQSSFYNINSNVGLTWVQMLTVSGSLMIDNLTTGSVYNGGGAMTDGVTITPAAIDAGGGAGLPGIFNPRSLAGFL